jgi:Transposase DDE domain group 1
MAVIGRKSASDLSSPNAGLRINDQANDVLIERLRALALQGTALASAQVDTLRIKLLKVASVVTRNTRRIRLYLASHWPSADVFAHAVSQLRSP